MSSETHNKPGALVIDAQANMATLVADMLRTLGRRDIREAYDGATAQFELRRRPFEIIILDDGIGGPDAVDLVRRLRADPTCRDAAITTFEPLADTTYVPCVSLLDFWLPDGTLELVVYAHSLDFGKKAYGNLVELAALQQRVAGELDVEVGRLVVHAKSAHVYGPELAPMRELVSRR